jgi:hypothetical protein
MLTLKAMTITIDSLPPRPKCGCDGGYNVAVKGSRVVVCEEKVRGFEAINRMVGKLKKDLAPMDQNNGEEQVRSRSMNQQGHLMI